MIMLSGVQTVNAAQITGETQDITSTENVVAEGFFYLSAVTLSENIIEPVKICYTQNATVKEALQASGYTFMGLEEGFIHAIEGIDGNFSVLMSDGGYDLNRAASEVSVVAFTEGEVYSSEMVALITRMGEYNAMTNHVQNYAKATEAYEKALEGLAEADAETAQKLLTALNAAIAEYEELFNGEKKTVTVTALQGENTLTAPVLTFMDSYGNVTEAVGTSVDVLAGEYAFVVSDGSYNRTEGTVTVTEETELHVTLPSGEWFGDIQILRKETDAEGNKIPYAYTQDTKTHTAEYFIDDTAGKTGSTYLYAGKGADWLEGTKLYGAYKGLNGTDYGTVVRSWESSSNALVQAIDKGMEGNAFPFEARYTGEDGYVMIQSYDVILTRVPTLSSIVLKDGNGTSLLTDFASHVKTYSLNTINDTLSVEAAPYGAEGYSVRMEAQDKEADYCAKIADGENVVTVVVSHTNGQSTSYIFTVNKTAAATVTMETVEGVTVEVVNENGNVIAPKAANVYELIPGNTYNYIATKEENYHATAAFIAEENATVTVAAPVVETAMTKFALYDGSSKTTRKELVSETEFSSDIYEYTYVVSDANSALYAQATKESAYTATAKYTKKSATSTAVHNVEAAVNIAKTVSSTGTTTSLTAAVAKSGYGNTITLRLWKEADNVTYYQDYILHINRSLHLADLSVSIDTGSLSFVDANKASLAFDRDIFEYSVLVPSSTEQVCLQAEFMNETAVTDVCGGYYAMLDGVRYDSLAEVNLALDVSAKEETKEIKVYHENGVAISNTYVVKVKKQTPVKVTFAATPEDAIVFVVNQVDNKPVFAENGIFELMPGIAYTYTVTADGYQAQKVTDFVLEEKETETIEIALTAANINENLKELEAQWPAFRDKNNNGVVDAKIPVKAEDAVLYWANKVGDSYGSGATGCPIMVDGYLYVYAGTSIVKVDSVTGEIKASGEMLKSSSFAINNPTYGNGMIFVGLSGGTIQAFNAETLESLWIYKDALGGQPNCHIAYHDGYVYTGFWNSETKDANYVCVSAADEDPTQTQEEKTASWVHTQAGGFYWAGAYVTDDFLLVGTDDGESGYSTGYAHILSIDPKSGKILDDMQLPHVGDLRSNITYDAEETKDYYFTTKGGYFYRISVNEEGIFTENSLKSVKLPNGTTTASMSTSTPTIYNGRAYVGVAGLGQFAAYSGHNIAVIDLARMKVAYSVPTQGYPQTSGVLTNAYEEETGKVYVYFLDNYTPGKLRVFSDMPGQTQLTDVTEEVVSGKTYSAGYTLFTPSGSQAQYAICSPIVDEYGTLYFKNDSAYLMALGATIEKIEVTQMPDKLVYKLGESFSAEGMKVTATYTNGKTRDITEYISYSNEPITENDLDFPITFEHVMYQDKDGQAGVDYTAPMTFVELSLEVDAAYVMNRIEEIGEVILEKEETIKGIRALYDSLSDEEKGLVENYSVLEAAEATFTELKNVADKEAADAVAALIKAIGEVSLESESAIEEARSAYEALTEDQKVWVSSEDIAVLEGAESTLAQLQKEKAEKEAAEREAAEKEAAEKEAAEKEAAEKEAAEKEAAEKEATAKAEAEKAAKEAADKEIAATVIAKIEAIGEVTLLSESAIQEAKTAYEALSENQKKYVDSVYVRMLTEAEAVLVKQQEAVKAGAEITVENYRYRITKNSLTDGTVEFAGASKRTEKSIKVPAEITIYGVTYKVTSIGKNAFKNNKKLTSVVIGKHVISIGSNAFNNCKKLKKLTLPVNVTKIGAYAFKNCTKLKTLTIKSKKITAKTLHKKAFSGLEKTTKIKVPKTKKKTYKKLFKKCGLSAKNSIK